MHSYRLAIFLWKLTHRLTILAWCTISPTSSTAYSINFTSTPISKKYSSSSTVFHLPLTVCIASWLLIPNTDFLFIPLSGNWVFVPKTETWSNGKPYNYWFACECTLIHGVRILLGNIRVPIGHISLAAKIGEFLFGIFNPEHTNSYRISVDMVEWICICMSQSTSTAGAIAWIGVACSRQLPVIFPAGAEKHAPTQLWMAHSVYCLSCFVCSLQR